MRWTLGFALLITAVFGLAAGYHLGVAYINYLVRR
jgi:hypothetical protein